MPDGIDMGAPTGVPTLPAHAPALPLIADILASPAAPVVRPAVAPLLARRRAAQAAVDAAFAVIAAQIEDGTASASVLAVVDRVERFIARARAGLVLPPDPADERPGPDGMHPLAQCLGVGPECWKPIPGWPRYEASDHGRIRIVVGSGRRAGVILQQHWDSDGDYLTVPLHRNGKRHSVNVHVLVCLAFHGPRPPRLVAAHWNGVAWDNSARNLAWRTQGDNIRQAYDDGTKRVRPRVLVYDDAVNIRRQIAEDGRTARAVAAEYGVSACHVANILAGRRWLRM